MKPHDKPLLMPQPLKLHFFENQLLVTPHLPEGLSVIPQAENLVVNKVGENDTPSKRKKPGTKGKPINTKKLKILTPRKEKLLAWIKKEEEQKIKEGKGKEISNRKN